jgi:hypothetical protein
MNQLDKNKAKVYEIIGNLIMKFLLTGSVIVAFFMVLVKLLDAETLFDAAKYTAIEAFLAGTVYVAFKHFFPPKK